MTVPGLQRTQIEQAAKDAPQGLTWRALVLAILLTIVCGIWVRQAEILVIATQVSEAVPAIPALAVLFLLLALNPLLRLAWPKAPFTRVEMLSIYTFVAIAITMSGVGVASFWLSTITALWWYGSPSDEMGALQHLIPRWAVPHSYDTVLGIYYGGQSVPWGEWIVPLLMWIGFLGAIWCAMMCLLIMVRKRWMQEERLSFPVVELALEMTDTTGRAAQRPFFLNPVMWVGFSLTFLFNLVNILHALRPAVPSIAWNTLVGPTNASLPWSLIFPIPVVFAPLLIGFGFLVSVEISFSIWFFFILTKLEALCAGSMGFTTAGVPYPQEQGMGAFILLGLGLLWAVRGTFKIALRDLFSRTRTPKDPGSPLALHWALVGLVVGSLLVLGFCSLLGIRTWAAVTYLSLLALTALVCARIRAEAGIPSLWSYPAYIPKQMLMYTFGSATLLAGGPTTLVGLALLVFLSRGFFPPMAGYQIDSFKTAEQSRMKPSHMAFVVVLACFVGLAVAFYFHLTPYYHYGATHLRNGDIWGTWVGLE